MEPYKTAAASGYYSREAARSRSGGALMWKRPIYLKDSMKIQELGGMCVMQTHCLAVSAGMLDVSGNDISDPAWLGAEHIRVHPLPPFPEKTEPCSGLFGP